MSNYLENKCGDFWVYDTVVYFLSTCIISQNFNGSNQVQNLMQTGQPEQTTDGHWLMLYWLRGTDKYHIGVALKNQPA